MSLIFTKLRALAAAVGTIAISASLAQNALAQQQAPAAPEQPKMVTLSAVGDADIQKIAAIVNDAPITEYDVFQRLAMLASNAGFQLSEQNLQRMRAQVLRGLIEETLKLQEADRLEVAPLKADVDKELEDLAAQNNTTVDEIVKTLAEDGIDVSTLRRQIAAGFVWGQIVRGRFSPQISVTEEEIDAAYQRQVANASKPQYRVQEIFIRVDIPEQEAEIRNGMASLWQQIQQGANFQLVAQQISQSPSAAQGGDIGWVQDGQLAPELNSVLRNLQEGQVSQPIRTISGYYLLRLVQRRMIGGADPLKAKVTMQQLVFGLAEDTPQEQIQSAGQYLMQASQAVKSCDDLTSLQQQMGSGALSERQTMTIGEVAPVFQTAIIPLQPGETSSPILTNQGFHLIAVCEREDIGLNLPSRDQIENQLASQQLAMMERRYIRDLRNDAVVEVR